MTGARGPWQQMRRMARDEAGTTLVEFAVVLPIFLLLLFALIDFGRMGGQYVMAGKATQLAARLAVVRPPACTGVRETYTLGSVPVGTATPKYGTNCKSAAYVCEVPATVTCGGADLSATATAAEIWAEVEGLMPNNATVANLQFSYAHTADFGFLGGPYVPMVTVQIVGLDFEFVSPLGALAELGGAIDPNLPTTLPFPQMSVSLPAEDLAQGNNG